MCLISFAARGTPISTGSLREDGLSKSAWASRRLHEIEYVFAYLRDENTLVCVVCEFI